MSTQPKRRRGATAVLAMLFLTLFSTLAVAMYSVGTLNTQTAHNLSDAERARSAAESGLRWTAWRFLRMNRPKTAIGNITASAANTLWPAIKTAVKNDFAAMLTPAERTITDAGSYLTSASIATSSGPERFAVRIQQHPLNGSDTLDQRVLRVTCTGTCGGATRTVYMDFQIDKKVKFAVAGKVPIQLGRNVLVEGPVAMATTAQPSGQPPILAMSDFRNLTTHLTGQVDAFRTFLEANYSGYDNRVAASNATVWNKAVSAGFTDVNADGYIDEYDLFLKEFDSNKNKAVSASEFTNSSTGKLYDDSLMTVIDNLGGPLYTGDQTRSGYQDGTIDNRDGYAKVRGQILVAETSDSLISRLKANNQTILDVIQGPIVTTDPSTPPVKFGAGASDIFDLSPADFDTSGFLSKVGTNAGTTSKSVVAPNAGSSTITNAVVSGADANGYIDSGGHVQKTLTGDQTPYGSTSYQAKYDRPVFTNVTFRNCKIAKGTNALFSNCTFEGVTFVDMTTNITNSSGQTTTNKDDGMTWSKRMQAGKGTFSATTSLNATNSLGFTDGNNLRFNDCTFHGPMISTVPTAYTHFSNSWEFTGKTLFDNQVDQTATIIAPQANIEMGSFTDPTKAPSTLTGVVVAGNIDIRGTGVVDGSILVTGDGAGNTTLGWFGASDGATDTSAPMPEGGFGRLNLRYNPYRPMPDGINVAIDILPDISTYAEGQ